MVKPARPDALQAIFARSWGKFICNEPRDQILFLFSTESHEDSNIDSNIDSGNEDRGIEDKDNTLGKDYVSSASVKGNLTSSSKFQCPHHFTAVSVLNTRGSSGKDKFKKT